MGLIIGLIGANIIAKNIGNKCIEYAETKAEAQRESERIRADAELEAERIRAKARLEAEQIKANSRARSDIIWAGTDLRKKEMECNTILETERIRAQKEIANTSMKTGFFSLLLGNGNNRENDLDSSYLKSNPIPQIEVQRKANYCGQCGEKQDDDSVFCKYCGCKL